MLEIQQCHRSKVFPCVQSVPMTMSLGNWVVHILLKQMFTHKTCLFCISLGEQRIRLGKIIFNFSDSYTSYPWFLAISNLLISFAIITSIEATYVWHLHSSCFHNIIVQLHFLDGLDLCFWSNLSTLFKITF